MHELGLTRHILEIVLETAAGRAVSRVELAIGTLTGVGEEHLRGYFALLAQGTEAENASLSVRSCPPDLVCAACAQSEPCFDLPLPKRCPRCGGRLRLGGGRQLEVLAIEVDDGDDGACAQSDPQLERPHGSPGQGEASPPRFALVEHHVESRSG